ncbi:MAG: hypothetical protein IKH57_06330 [Clostridia bacterium]|nr:hypothetical protein [Clostridia bacterium]
MKKGIALLLTLTLVFTCTAVLAEAAEIRTANYQFRNLTGDSIAVLTLTDNKTGEVMDLLSDGELFGADLIMYLTLYAEENETKEDLEHRYTLTFSNGDEEKVYEFKTLSFENVLIDLLAADAMTGATPIKFNTKMFQRGNYKIINKTDKMLKAVAITENANPDTTSIVFPEIDPGSFAFVDYIIDPENEAHHALTIKFTFEDDTECSFGSLSIEEASLTLTPDTVTGATPFTFGPIDAE